MLISDGSALQIEFSSNGSAPFTVRPSIVDPATRTITATITEQGFYFLDAGPLAPPMFADGFE